MCRGGSRLWKDRMLVCGGENRSAKDRIPLCGGADTSGTEPDHALWWKRDIILHGRTHDVREVHETLPMGINSTSAWSQLTASLVDTGCSIPVSTAIRDEDNLPYALSLYGPDPWASSRTSN